MTTSTPEDRVAVEPVVIERCLVDIRLRAGDPLHRCSAALRLKLSNGAEWTSTRWFPSFELALAWANYVSLKSTS